MGEVGESILWGLRDVSEVVVVRELVVVVAER